jgi:hypothetical protein
MSDWQYVRQPRGPRPQGSPPPARPPWRQDIEFQEKVTAIQDAIKAAESMGLAFWLVDTLNTEELRCIVKRVIANGVFGHK